MGFFKKLSESELGNNEMNRANEPQNLVTFASPDYLESIKIFVNILDASIKKVTVSDKHELSVNEFLRLYTLFELAKYKQNIGDFPVRIGQQIEGLYDYTNDTLYLFSDKYGIFNKINLDVSFILSRIMRNKHINKDRDFKDAIKKLKFDDEKARAEKLLSDEGIINTCNAFWDNVIVYYKKFQNDVVYNFLSNILKRYYLY